MSISEYQYISGKPFGLELTVERLRAERDISIQNIRSKPDNLATDMLVP